MKVIIAVPTCRRPAGLSGALESLKQIQIPPDLSVNIIVVDNDAKGSAKPIVEAFSRASQIEVFYFAEPQPGLSVVRNRILREAIKLNADYLAGIDDDEVASPRWLIRLWEGLKKYNADCAGGPQHFILPPQSPRWLQHAPVFRPYANRRTGQIVREISTGNYLLNLQFIKAHAIVFDPYFNNTGGEDSDFFSRCSQHGAKIVWIADAVVKETVTRERATLRWASGRCYRIGHTMVLIYKKKNISTLLTSLSRTLYYPLLSILCFISFQKPSGYRLFFRFIHHLGKLSACLGIRPRKLYYRSLKR